MVATLASSSFLGNKLLNGIFRHGERTVDPTTLYPTDPYINEKYYPYGVGQLTNAGKIREYNIGKALRKRYDNFLGKIYEPDILDALSTDFNRTKMSLELVLAGLFPPVGDQIFEPGLYWQPIPYNFLPRNQDKLLLGILCPNYKKFYARLTKSKKLQRDYYEHRDLFKYLSVNSGWNISDYNDIFYLYFGLRSEKEWGFELPEWTNMVYPQPLEDLSISGYHLQKIIEDTKAKITGALKPSKRKIFLYSCHESNIANFLTTLDVFEPQIPPYGCYILVEVHKIEGVYGIKVSRLIPIRTFLTIYQIDIFNDNELTKSGYNYGIHGDPEEAIFMEQTEGFIKPGEHLLATLRNLCIYYQDYIGDGPKLLKLPACDAFCPLDKFIALTEEYIPAIDSCGRDE
ncbi:hypothetical protein NQ314_003835 [Rhamnusium bicolor]|uniref:acid phosphatase n=1 Tax=Rhamnusium bicolor TaxID=1586634 RepID=A0AAV8ZLB6_9CUCU|nr:hypothetical protein NQ314_003835 [Rhamnusium bicolor]